MKVKVRVLGFNHDILTNTAAYGTGTYATTAGISFEFIEFMIDDTKQMGSTDTSEGGWPTTAMREFLEGDEGIGLISEACRTNIKQVEKQYIKISTDASSNNNYSSDRLWLLSCSEIWANGKRTDTPYGYAIAKEGEQYQFYKDKNPDGSSNTANEYLQKKITSGQARIWWLRSRYSTSYGLFCIVGTTGDCARSPHTTADFNVAPGFSI